MSASPATLEALGLRPGGAPAASDPDAVLDLRARLRAWYGAHRASVLTLVALSLLITITHAWGTGHAPAMSDDEGTYMAQAWAVQTTGKLAPYTYWYDHPPFGWLQLSLLSWITGALSPAHHAVTAGRAFMVLAAVASGVLLFVLCRRLGMRRAFAASAVVLFALSPLALDYQRLVFLDNIGLPWLMGALVLAASPRRSLWAAAASGGCFAAAVASKETMLLALPAVLSLLWLRSDRRTRSFCVTGFAATGVLLLAAYPLYALLKGELVPGPGHVSLLQAIGFQLFNRAPSGSVFSASSNAHHQLVSWLRLDGWLLGLGLIALPVGLAVRRLRPLAIGLGFQVLLALRGGYLPDPFVIALLPFAAALVAGVFDTWWAPLHSASRRGGALRTRGVWTPAARRITAAAVAGALAVVLAVDWAPGDRTLMVRSDATAPTWAAERWVEANVAHRDRLIVDDSIWVDLVEHGFSPHLGVVWFYKLDFSNNLDPSVAKALPQGWRDLQWVVVTPIIRSALAQQPGGLEPVREAIASSRTVATFGTGDAQVQVRRITGSLPAPAPTR